MTRAVLLLALIATRAALADGVDVQVSSRSIADGDDLQVTFTFSGDGDQEVPSFEPDWTVAGQSNSTSISMMNGRVDRSLAATFSLVPKRTGTLTIGPAKLSRGGRVVAQSAPIQVQVRGAQAMTPSEAAKGSPGDNAFFILEVGRDQVFVGEPFVVTAAIYTRPQIELVDAALMDANLPDSIKRTPVLTERLRADGQRRFGGEAYTRTVVFQEIWTVLRPETLAIPGIRVAVAAGRGFGVQQAKLKASPLTLPVVPVPTAGRPAAYREGAVGQFAISASLTPDQARSRAVLEIAVTGEGSLETLDPPAIPAIAGATLEKLPADDQDKVAATPNGMTGKRVFQYLVNPQRAGAVLIPALDFAWFDPDKGAFESAKTEPLQYEAAGGVAVVAKRVDPERPTFEARRALQPIETQVTLAAPAPPPLHRRAPFLGLLGGALGLFALVEGAAWTRRRAASGAKNRPKRALTTAMRRLDAARASSSAEFFGDVAKALSGYLEDRHGLAMAGATESTLRAELSQRGHKAASIDAVVSELQTCDAARFAPGGDAGELEAARRRVKALLEALEAER